MTTNQEAELRAEESMEFPWAIVKIFNQKYALNCRHVESMNVLPEEISTIPNAKKSVRGVIKHRGKIVTVIDIRTLFSLPTIEEEYEEFAAMLDQRKQEHVRWVDTLEQSMKKGEAFTLATDPHKCAFGMWYDGYKSNKHHVNFELSKIDEPHRKLHGMALEAEKLKETLEGEALRKAQEDLIIKLRSDYMAKVLQLIDNTKALMKESNKSMVLILETGDAPVGLVVDEIVSVTEIRKISSEESLDSVRNSPYVCGVGEEEKTREIVMLLNEAEIIKQGME